MFLCVLALACGGAIAAKPGPEPVRAQEAADYSVLPADMEALRDLDARHRAIVRRAARMCSGLRGTLPRTGLYADPCVRRNVESGLEKAEDPQLTAFHYALPLRVRYDGLRSEADWRRAVNKA
ncbi:MAG: hypothetical protein ACLFV8_09600, partial [Alphaproteobacteria bacterium]